MFDSQAAAVRGHCEAWNIPQEAHAWLSPPQLARSVSGAKGVNIFYDQRAWACRGWAALTLEGGSVKSHTVTRAFPLPQFS